MAATAAFGLTASLHAQGPGGPGSGGMAGGEMMGRPPGGGPGGDADTMAVLVKTLNLTNAQKTQVQPIADAATAQTRSIREEAAARAEEVVKSAEAQMKPLLTPYQQQVMASMDKNREAMKKPGRQGGPGGGLR